MKKEWLRAIRHLAIGIISFVLLVLILMRIAPEHLVFDTPWAEAFCVIFLFLYTFYSFISAAGIVYEEFRKST